MRVLVTGGAGYIGSHIVQELLDAGHDPVALDDLSGGNRALLPDIPLLEVDLTDATAVRAAIDSSFDAVVHCAGLISVSESVADPLRYYEVNVGGTINLLRACLAGGVERIVFSSSAAVYGVPEGLPVTEGAPLQPISPYGATKLMVERLLQDMAKSGQLSFMSLRYFNVGGADPEGRRGESHNPETHLIPLAIRATLAGEPALTIHGSDYPTPDGTCIRDYVHVMDVAGAHRLALEHLGAGGASMALNCGYGHGHSVREVLDSVHRVTGREVPVEMAPRRPGDPPRLMAQGNRIRECLGWRPRYESLDEIIRTAWHWERRRTP